MANVVVPWAVSSQIGVFGKLPGAGDFIHVRNGDDQKWCDWLQRGVERANVKLAARWPSAFDQGVPHGFLMRQASGAVLAGFIKPSRDAVGRRFPLSVYTQLSPSDAGGVRHLVPWALAPFNQMMASILTAPDPHLEPVDLIRGISIHAVAAEQGQTQYQDWLRSTVAATWFDQVWGRRDREVARYCVAMIASSIGQYVGHDHSANPLAMRLPLAGDLRAAAFWLDLVGRLGGWKTTVPTTFWEAAHPGTLLVQLGEAKPSSYVELWAPGSDDEHVIDMHAAGAVNAAPFMISVSAPLQQRLTDDTATLWDVLAAAGPGADG